MKKVSPLTSLGLHQEEIIIYEELIARGPLSPTELCTYTKLHRPTLYFRLEELTIKDLVSIVPFGKRKKYVANSPKKLKELSNLQEKHIQDEIIRLEEKAEVPTDIPYITVRKGNQAIRLIYEEMVQELKKDGTYYYYASIDDETWIPGRYITHRAKHLRDIKALQRYIITNEETKIRKRKNLNRLIKTVPRRFDLFKHNVVQVIYGNKVVIIDYNNETAVTIDNTSIASFHKALFKTFFHYL